MPSHYRMNEYEHEDYDEYEEDGSDGEGEEEEVVEEGPPSQEQQEFLKLRELLKDKYRQKFKKEAAGAFGRSQSKRATTNDNFGSFFGPSQPVIASRVLDERRSIQETQHIISRVPNGSSGNAKNAAYTSSEKKTFVHKQQPKAVNEVKKKAQTLKDMRDYSFLLSDDADLPDAQEEQRPARNVPASGSGGRLDQAPPKSRPQMARPARPAPSGHGLCSPTAKTPQSHSRVGPGGGAALHRHKPATVMPRKIDNPRNGSGRPVVQKPLPSKVPAHMTGTSRSPANVLKPPANAVKGPYPKSKQSAAVPYSSAQKNHYMEQKRLSQSLNNMKLTPNRPLPSSKSQLPKKMPPRGGHEVCLKKKSTERRLDDYDDDDDEDAIGMIRKMFGYNPSKYKGIDDDIMVTNFDEINKEEKRSELIAREEDEEQQRLLEEEEKRRMRKKQKLKR